MIMNREDFLESARGHIDAIFRDAQKAATTIAEKIIAEGNQILAIDSTKLQENADAYELDMALQRVAPTAVVPLHAPFAPLTENGHRFLMASDGMYIEVRRPWLYFVHRLCEQSAVTMPYGSIKPATELAFGRLSNIMDQVRSFATSAIVNEPNEHAEMLIWNSSRKELYEMGVEILDATPSSLKYKLKEMADDESVAVDLHSHGSLPAFFSREDDLDDAGSVKIAGVLGNLDTATPTAAFRLCVLGLYIPINVPAEKIFGNL
jgi:PRTRC genetic system protein A